ncbi:MAG: NADH-quinone oxidoreductase subunit A [Cyclobacteriaceae bacterium]|nr:MAG: NADH-quinone oxidoreductase subunit A [Cyclobacteriaceae bacterium]
MGSSLLFLIYAFLVVTIPIGTIVLSWFLGQKNQNPKLAEPYESGIPITDSARLRFPSKFYLVAMFFVIFDLEVVFIFAWAIAYKQVGWAGYFAVLVFILVLAVVLLYEWRTGALDFGPQGKNILKAYKKLSL